MQTFLVKCPSCHRKFSIPFGRKISPGDSKKIVALYGSGVPSSAISKQFGVSRQAVIDCLRRKGIDRRRAGLHRKYPVNESYFDRIDTSDKAYWLGFLYADGCNHGYGISVHLNAKDENHLSKLRDILSPSKMIGHYTYIGRNPSVNLNLRSSVLSSRLSMLGCIPRKSLILRFPKRLKLSLHSHFIRGYSDGDGWIICDRKLNVGTWGICGTRSFCESVHQVLIDNLNVNSTVRKDGRSRTWSLVVGGNRQVLKALHWLYGNSEVSTRMKRKFEKYVEIQKMTMRS